jgi:Ca2+-binding EF-hand superfamily protein
MGALLDAQSQTNVSAQSKTRSDALKSLFAQLDGNSDGSISRAEFEDKLGAGGTNVANADKVFAKLDKDGDGSVSIDELSKALKGAGKAHHGGSGNADGSGDGSDVAGATTSTTVNADGSTTTSISYADGSKVTSTSAVPSASTTAAARTSYNALEQMIAKQAQQISTATGSLAISV